MRKVVVTGLGAVTPIGNNVKDMWDAALKGTCGIGRITHYDPTGRKVTLAGEVKDLHPERILSKAEIRRMDDYTVYAMLAAREAMKDSALDMEAEDRERCGIIFSSGVGGIGTIQEECLRGMNKGFDRVSPHFIPKIISNMAAGQIAIAYGFHGMCSCVVTACASSANAIGDAFRQIRDGYQDVMLCGGSEAAITPLAIGGFTSMNALNRTEDPERASIPFDKERNGFVMGEGSAALILEDYDHARKRGAKIYCEIAGYGSSCDAFHITAPLEDGSMAASAMTHAIKDAGIRPEQIDYINAHGTSTPLNDKGETLAVKMAFGEHARKLLISSTKSMTGHLLGASGAVEAVFCVLSVKNDVLLPTIHYKVPDEDCDLNIVTNVKREAVVNYAMSNSLGFGGHNASVIFAKCR